MAASRNGLALSGLFIPFGSSFLIFTDDCRPSIRLSALMEQQVVFVFTHDSVFLGEDGPTHQPIEQLASLRLIPNLDVVRPADALECAAAWAHALTRRHGPTLIALRRHKLPALERPAGFDPRALLDGAYVLADAPDPEVVVIATGSEVGAAVDAKKRLDQAGKRVRVVSAPCWEAFSRVSPDRRSGVIPEGALLVTVEAGRTSGWAGVTGPSGLNIGVDRFGASAPWERLAVELGLTGEAIAKRILERLG
jgi:transketolase